MSDLLASIIESIAGSLAAARDRQIAQAQAAAPAQRPAPAAARAKPSVPMGRIAPQPAAAARTAGPAATQTPPPRALDVGAMFATSDRLLQTVIAAEILGPPAAMRRQNLWDVPGV